MVFEINHFNAKGVLRAGFLFKVENGICSFYEREAWLSCKDNLIGLLPLLHIPYFELLQLVKDKNDFIYFFPIDKLVIKAMSSVGSSGFWPRRVIEQWLEDKKFIITNELKSELLNLDKSRLNENLQNRLAKILLEK